MVCSRKVLCGIRRDLIDDVISEKLKSAESSRSHADITHSSSGEAAPQLLATKRLVEDDLAAAATKLTSAFAAAVSIITMVEITV